MEVSKSASVSEENIPYELVKAEKEAGVTEEYEKLQSEKK